MNAKMKVTGIEPRNITRVPVRYQIMWDDWYLGGSKVESMDRDFFTSRSE